MTPDIQRPLIPRDHALRLVGTLNALTDKLLDASQQWELLDEHGQVPDAPSYTALLQHAADAQDLFRDVLKLTADFARSPHSTTPAGSAVLTFLAVATSMSGHAAPHFAETAECALALPRSSHPADRPYLANRMVGDHAIARARLRHASQVLRKAAEELNDHLDLHDALPPLLSRDTPVRPPPGPQGRHR
ncbi:hypothetical protein SLNWT_7056 [Streptomyces albus]|uniref:Uncharacterized protein n=1 Tax=Streptomyces albus (strain ATCC 21838 / DSM 41398 / FERM P-419 / JCM 4703 / NBRC 107858) TaxID=1081613 RepID=A0A0B5FAE8_STRA4|nr:hypothetical protein SLNWT_7056 [Streptomyces albus]AOU81735.1 hypothetical protein SLNHY_7044 [Streptomyces albus]AYN37425.1 hypothetical protein DUI70_6932 [Streptomyces albus]